MGGMILRAALFPAALSFRAREESAWPFVIPSAARNPPRVRMPHCVRHDKGPYDARVAKVAVAELAEPAPRLPLRLYPALGVRAYRQLWLGMMPATLSWQMNIVVTGYAAFQLSNSATALGLTSSAQGVPMILLALIGGVVADRLPRRS